MSNDLFFANHSNETEKKNDCTTNETIQQLNYIDLKIATNQETPQLPFDFSTHIVSIRSNSGSINCMHLCMIHCKKIQKKMT